jgi:hypothetical protein
MRFFSSLVDILGDDRVLPVECQGEQLRHNSQMVGNPEVGQIGNKMSATLETKFWMLARLSLPMW